MDRSLLSLLDILTCAFGAAILLGLVFSVSQEAGQPVTRATEFALFRFTVRDPSARMTFVVSDDRGRKHEWNLNDDLANGMTTRLGSGDDPSTAVLWGPPRGMEVGGGSHTYSLLLRTNRPGEWFAGLRYANSAGVDWSSDVDRRVEVGSAVTYRLTPREEGEVDPFPPRCQERPVGLGDVTGCWVTIPEPER